MAVPKKKTSRSKRNSRRKTWNRKVSKNFSLALSLGRAFQSKNTPNFVLDFSLD